jgi:hypothetical protein
VEWRCCLSCVSRCCCWMLVGVIVDEEGLMMELIFVLTVLLAGHDGRLSFLTGVRELE